MDRLLELTRHAEAEHFWFRGFRRFVRPLVTSAAATCGSSRCTVLDCGCGTGVNLEWLREFGTAYGFDLSRHGLLQARQLGRTSVARASIAAIPFPSGIFDVVTSFDVFQTLPDEVEKHALAEMRRVLRPGGHIVLSVAALEVLRGRHAVLSEEVRRYTPARLRSVIEAAGFRIERLTFGNAVLLPMMLPVRLLQRLRSRGPLEAGEFDITVPPAPINALLSAALAAEAAVLRVVNMPVGSSLFCLAQRE